MLTREQFDQFVQSAFDRGFTHVLVGADAHPLPLEQWRPYGAFDGSNPGIEKHMTPFTWIAEDKATDAEMADAPKYPLAAGCWTFVNLEDDTLEEQNSNYNRMIGESLRRY